MTRDAVPAVTPEEAVARAFRAFFARDAERLIAFADHGSLIDYASRVTASATAESGVASPEELIAAALSKFPPVVGTMSIDTFGHVSERPEIAHVVYRLTIQTPSGPAAFFPEPQLATVKLEAGNWRLVLDPWADAGIPGFRTVIWWDEGSEASSALPPQDSVREHE